jgi:hypothetical protein
LEHSVLDSARLSTQSVHSPLPLAPADLPAEAAEAAVAADAAATAVAAGIAASVTAVDSARTTEPPAHRRSASVRTLTERLDHADRAALGYWILAHLVLILLAYTAAWTASPNTAHLPLLGGFEHWDANLLSNIAAHGYYGQGSVANNTAFFPGYPLALAGVHLAVRNWVASSLLLSLIAGSIAVVCITRLAGSSRAALYLITAPVAVFLAVGYSESLFLAFALPAWSAARSGQWRRSGIYASFAAFTRPDGLFLIAALAVMALTCPDADQRPPAPRSWLRVRLSALSGVALGLIGPGVYELYLFVHTGRWSAWVDANQAGWGLHYVGPWQSLKTSYWGAFQHPYSGEFGFMEQLEIVCLAVLLAAALAFAVRRRWPEAVYCALAAFGLGTQTWYQSVPRTLLITFPIWIALARFTRTRPWANAAYLALSGSLAAVIGMLYLSGTWAG